MKTFFTLFFVMLFIAIFLFVVNINYALEPKYPKMLWFYGAPRSWGVLGYNLDNSQVKNSEELVEVLFTRSEQVQEFLQHEIRLHADLIFLTPNGYNRYVERSVILILEKDPTATVSINITVGEDWTIENVENYIKIIWSGRSGWLDIETIKKYSDRITMSIDFELMAFNASKTVNSAVLRNLDTIYQTTRETTNLEWFLYDFRMFRGTVNSPDNITPIFNGIGESQESLYLNYINVYNQWKRPLGLMAFIFDHLGEEQKSKAFSNIDEVFKFLDMYKISPEILAFQ